MSAFVFFGLLSGLVGAIVLFAMAEEVLLKRRASEQSERQRELWRSGGIARRDKFVRVEQSWLARRSHTPKVAGSNPAPATIFKGGRS